MKQDILELESVLYQAIKKYSIKKEVYHNIQEKLYAHNIDYGMKLLAKQTPLQTQPLVVLFYLIKYFYEETQDYELKPELFFTEIEINEFQDFTFQKELDTNNIEFKGFIKGFNDIYTGVLGLQTIKRLWEQGVATYNFQTQRNTVLTKYKNEVLEDIFLDKNSVKDIAKLLVEKSYIPISPIVFNILKNGEEEFLYDEKNYILTFKKGLLNCTDGFHRTKGIMDALLMNPGLDMLFPVTFTHFTKEKARQMIFQEDHKNKIDKNYIKTLNEEDLTNYIVKELNERTGEMKGKISHSKDSIRYEIAFVSHNVLYSAIESNFKYKNRREAEKLIEYLINGFNEIIGIFYDEFLKRDKNLLITSNNMFVGYIALLSTLKDNSEWKGKLEKTLLSIDFNMANKDWEDIAIVSEANITKQKIRRISDYFIKLIK